jgi:hypothetical protein
LAVGKKLFDVLVSFSKLATVTFIEDKHKFFILQMLNFVEIASFNDRIVELLDGGDDELSAVVI